MTAQEANLLVEAHNEQYKEEWNRLRWVAYITAVSNGARKIKKPQDLIEFSWEKHMDINDGRTPEQKEAARQRMIKYYSQQKSRTPEEIQAARERFINSVSPRGKTK